MEKCKDCPLMGEDLACPGSHYCRHATAELKVEDPRQHFWRDRIRQVAQGNSFAVQVEVEEVSPPVEILPKPNAYIEKIPRLPTYRPTNLAKEIVVAHYKENLYWLTEVPGVWHKTVYTKNDLVIPGGVSLPNIGREAHTYLWHIVNHYDDLAEWTVFTQAGFHNSSVAELVGRMAVEYSDSTSLTREYSPIWPSEHIKAMDSVEWHGGYEVRYGLIAPINEDWCDAANLSSEEVWSTVFEGERPDPFVFGYTAQWMVPRHRITDRPLCLWRHLLDKVSAIPNSFYSPARSPFNAWHLEMVWGYLFGDAEVYRTIVKDKASPIRRRVKPKTYAELMEIREIRNAESKSGCNCGGPR